MGGLRQTVLGLLMTIAILAPPCQATCRNARMMSTLLPLGSYSYIYTPGVEPTSAGSSITDDFEGFFWALGAGAPSVQQGHDSGAFVALGGGRNGWVQHPAGYPATFDTTWAAGKDIDGCIDDVDIRTTCTLVLLTDQHAERGYFALLSAAPVLGNYSFVQAGNAPITLAPIPRPQTVDVATTAPNVIQATVRIDEPASGLYLAGSGCPRNVVAGYKIYAQAVTRGSAPPGNRSRTRSGTGGGTWKLADGGEALSGQALGLGTSADVTISCQSPKDVYLAVSIVFDSGFETKHLSENSAVIPCGE